MACSTEKRCSIFLAPFPGTLSINYFQTESIEWGWSKLTGFVCWLCVWWGGWHNCQAEVKKEKEYFSYSSQGDLLKQRCLSAVVHPFPDVYTMMRAEQTWRQAVPGRGLHGQAHTNIPRDAVWGHQLYQPSVPSSCCAAGTVSKGMWWTRPPGWKGPVCSGVKYFL